MGARNAKEWRFSINIADTVNGRLEAMCDRLGMNKGTASTMCLGLGLGVLENTLAVDPPMSEEERTEGQVLQNINTL